MAILHTILDFTHQSFLFFTIQFYENIEGMEKLIIKFNTPYPYINYYKSYLFNQLEKKCLWAQEWQRIILRRSYASGVLYSKDGIR